MDQSKGEMERRGIVKEAGVVAVIMELMCNKLHEGAFRETLFSSSIYTHHLQEAAHTSDTKTHKHMCNTELCVTHNLIHIYDYSNTTDKQKSSITSALMIKSVCIAKCCSIGH